MKQLRAGVVGVGFVGAAHIEQLRRLGGVEVVAIAERFNAQQLAESIFVPRGYENYREMIDNEKLNCVHICTPNDTHHEIAIYAMQHGINVVCEKPMACTVAQSQEMRDLAVKKGLVNAINFNYRFHPMVHQMREMIKSGELGEIYSIHGGYLQDWLFYDTDYSWRLESGEGGISRAFSDIGSHWIDLVEFVTGLQVTELLADTETFHKTRKKPIRPVATYSGVLPTREDYQKVAIDSEDYASVLFHLNNGAHACCSINQMFAGRKNQIQLSVAGSRCSLHWDSEKCDALWVGQRDSRNGELVKAPSVLADSARRIVSYPGGHSEGFPDTFKQNFKQIYARIAGDNTGDTGFATFEVGLHEVQLCESIVKSAKERCWVAVEHTEL